MQPPLNCNVHTGIPGGAPFSAVIIVINKRAALRITGPRRALAVRGSPTSERRREHWKRTARFNLTWNKSASRSSLPLFGTRAIYPVYAAPFSAPRKVLDARAESTSAFL